MGGQPLPQHEPGIRGHLGQVVQLRPRALRVDVVGGQRGHPAEVVHAGGEQQPALVQVDQVRRRLDPGPRAEHDPGDRDRGQPLVQRYVALVPHRGVRLGPEPLDDHFLDPAVLPCDAAQREDRVGPFREVLADADQQSGGERYIRAAGVLEHPDPDRGVLVRRPVVRAAALVVQAPRGGLQHHAHAGRDRLEPLQVLPGHHARVQVRQQPGLLQHPDRHRADVVQRGGIAGLLQPGRRRVPAIFRPVAEREQHLLAAELRAAPGDREHLVRTQVRRVHPARRGRERAVVAAVPAQPGERHEHLLREGDDALPAGVGEAGVTDPGGDRHQPFQRLAGGAEQHLRLGHIQGLAVVCALERPPHREVGHPGEPMRPGETAPGSLPPAGQLHVLAQLDTEAEPHLALRAGGELELPGEHA